MKNKKNKARREPAKDPGFKKVFDKDASGVKSITRKLFGLFAANQFRSVFFLDLILLLSLFILHLLDQEWTINGAFYRDAARRITGSSFDTLTYEISRDGSILLSQPLAPFLRILTVLAACLVFIQGTGFLFSFSKTRFLIREYLSPINEIALRADELSRISFSEDKYQLIEDAITRIQPEDHEVLAFQDKDLAGIEAAMNNLLRRIQEANRQQARFVNDASHELRTPIAVIEGYARMLDRWGKTDPRILDESLEAIKTESAHMKHLVEQLLFLARGDSGRTQLKAERLSVHALTEEIYEEVLLIDEAHVYRFLPHPEDTVIEGDAALLKQAVRILLDNASKYTDEGREIVISCGRDELDAAYIQVQDTGLGMDEKEVKQMFERFYRSDSVRNYPGTGLGLSIAKWIVDKHKAHFEITSRKDVGTRIRIVFPVNGAEEGKAAFSAPGGIKGEGI